MTDDAVYREWVRKLFAPDDEDNIRITAAPDEDESLRAFVRNLFKKED